MASMLRRRLLLALLLFSAGALQASPAWKLIWSDEFNGPKGSRLDPKKWNYEKGATGFGNGELQTYTDLSENISLDGAGNLDIQALRRHLAVPGGSSTDYTSARVNTKGLFQQAYGMFTARIRVPIGKGFWPAFWLLGADIDRTPWPGCGEIDIMENLGREPATIYGSLHGPGYSGSQNVGLAYHLRAGRFADDFHVFSVVWEPGSIRWYVDQQLYETRSPTDLGARRWVFDHPQYVLLNLAVGGGWPGPPDAFTRFPQSMKVDYVRVYSTPDLMLKAGAPAPSSAPNAAPAVATAVTYKSPGPIPLPGRLLAVDFATDGPEKAYHDLDPANQGGGVRPEEGVDTGVCSDQKGAYSVGWVSAGEWLDYVVRSQGGRCRVRLRTACQGPGGKIRLAFNGQDLGISLSIPDTGGWGTWKTVESEPFQLPAGAGRLRINMVQENPQSHAVGNLFYLDFVPVEK